MFVKNDKHVTGPRIPGETELAEPVFPPGEEYQVKPADGVVSVPRFSRRAKLASLTTGGGNRAFNENIANRLWAVMMGRGLVHPVDLHHPSNPPSQPELLKLLADEIVARNFNARDFLRELALTKAYQQAIDLPEETSAVPAAVHRQARRAEGPSRAARSRRGKRTKSLRERRQSLAPDRRGTRPARGRARQDDAQARRSGTRRERQPRRPSPMARRRSPPAAIRPKPWPRPPRRAQDVVKKLPKDKELVDAAAIFTKRHAAATAELAALEKADVAKKAALKKAAEESSRPPSRRSRPRQGPARS